MPRKHPRIADQSVAVLIRDLERRIRLLEARGSFIEIRTDDPDTDTIGDGYKWYRIDTQQFCIWTGNAIRRSTVFS
jgi:hypothetical protein